MTITKRQLPRPISIQFIDHCLELGSAVEVETPAESVA